MVNNKIEVVQFVLEKEMATHSSILAWKIPWTEEPGRLQPIASRRDGHNCNLAQFVLFGFPLIATSDFFNLWIKITHWVLWNVQHLSWHSALPVAFFPLAVIFSVVTLSYPWRRSKLSLSLTLFRAAINLLDIST